MNELSKLRHKWEMPLVWLNGIVTLAVIGFAIWYLVHTFNTNPEIFIGDEEISDEIGDAILIILGALFGPYLFIS